jgi:hypothetical protein
MMRTFNLRRRDIPLGLAVSGWLVLGITAIAGHNLIRPLAVFAALAAEAIAIGHATQPARVLAVLAVICSCAALIELTREVGRS